MLATNLTFIAVFDGKLQSSLRCSFIGMELDLPRYALIRWIAFPLSFLHQGWNGDLLQCATLNKVVLLKQSWE